MNETAAAYGMGGWPLEAVVAGLFVIVMARSHLFYWLGRGVVGGATRLADRSHVLEDLLTPTVDESGARARVLRLMRTPGARRGLALVHRWGPLAVTAAYLTVGVQTAVFVASGLLRMPYPRFLLASVPGSIAWAFIWGTIGIGAVWAGLRLAAASPWALAGALLVVAAVVAALVARRRSRRSAQRLAAESDRPADADADELV
ncbi:DedA family protein [Cellulomonas sp. NPDC058312]|uniref:DedA family protein n=1 Tax=Cellulomonas sp. NPDC058312 TaxID=3346441 RepID=UPI0036E597E9